MGEGNYSVKVKLYKYKFALGSACDQETFTINLTNQCSAFSGTLTADATPVSLIEGSATISATPNGDIHIPDGYSSIYVLTQGSDLVIVNAGAEPSFPVTEAGSYTIHTLVYNPNTLDLGIVEIGQTTGVDVFGLITEGGGSICASLDVTGAPIMVEACEADAGTITADMSTVCYEEGSTMISATPDENSNVPDGYSTVYVLTQGSDLVIVNAGAEPSFPVTEEGNYTIHTLVYNPDTLDLGIVELGQTTGVDVYGLLIDGGGSICASLDVAGAPITVENPDSGTLTADATPVSLIEGSATISATPNGDIHIPDGYSSIYVLTQGSDLVIVNAGAEPSFPVTEAGSYTIHTLVYNPNTLDLGIVEIGQTTGVDVFGLITEGGGSICASLDVAGAPIMVEACEADAGTITADMSTVCYEEGSTMISATPDENSNVPDGYSTVYVLTQGSDLVIVNAGAEPSFPVTEEGNYTIHTLVYNPDTLDLGIVELGQTTGVDVYGLLIDGGGSICASLDVAGAPITVENPDAGTLTADATPVSLIDGSATISATPNGDIHIPDGYSSIYVLTQGSDLVIVNAGAEPSFPVTEAGNYTIHTLVYNPDTLDLGIVEIGQTTGVDVFGLITEGGGSICASLDVAGAPIMVEACEADAGTITADMSTVCYEEGSTMISATPDGNSNVPDGYSTVYVLTQGSDLVIVNAGAEPSFPVTEEGNYTIHTLVYNPDTLDLGIVELGVTTGVDVYGLLIDGGGSICASLDVAGAPITVENPDAGTLTADATPVSLIDGSATISATPNGDIHIPDGYSSIYVLTQGSDLVIVNAGAEPSFPVTEAGNYTIHTLVYNPNTLDLGIVEIGETTGVDVFGLITEGGGSICASLDVAGAPIMVEDEACEAYAGTLRSNNLISCLSGGSSIISAYENYAPVIPDGYQQLFVLTNAFNLKILEVSASPEFDVDHVGFYRIHSLVYNPETLDLGIVQIGQTTGFDVNGLLQQGGGDICASLDVQGAVFLVLPSWICNWFNYSSYNARGGDPSAEVEGYISQFENYKAFERSILKDNEPRLYPNPVNDILNIDIKLFDDETMSYTISDLGGRLIQSGSVNEITRLGNTIETGRLSSGTYLISFTSDYRNFVKKIQVSK